MSKKPAPAEPSAAGTAVPEKLPAHKRRYITRHGGSVVLPAPAAGDDLTQQPNTTATEGTTHA